MRCGDEAYSYDAFGNQTSETENVNPFRYAGEYWDSESGLIYLRARYYDSGVGGFISEDPARDGLNWYSYCAGNPVNFWDPLGLARWIRDLVSETTGSIGWNMFTNTATVEVDGKKQEYVVGSDYWVRVNGNIVGYLENDKIMIEEYDFNVDFDIAGTITIYSYYDPYEENPNSSMWGEISTGHAWIGYDAVNGESVNVKTSTGETYTGTSFTVSAWKNKDNSAINRYFDQTYKRTNHSAYYSKKITKNQRNKMLNAIENTSVNWSYYNNCAEYANNIFNQTTGINIKGGVISCSPGYLYYILLPM